MLVIYDLSPHGLLGADEVSGDHVMVADNYMLLLKIFKLAVVQATPQFYVLFVFSGL